MKGTTNRICVPRVKARLFVVTAALGLLWSVNQTSAITSGIAAATPTPTPPPASLLEWKPSGLSSYQILALAIAPTSPNIVYAGDGRRIFKTIDGGANWSEVYSGLAGYSLAIDPTNANVVYAGQFGYEVLKTINGGATWVELPSIGASTHRAIAIDPGNTAIVYVGVADGWGVYKTAGGGANWNNMLSTTDVTSLALDGVSGNTIYVGSKNYYNVLGGVLKSSDGGMSWTRVMTYSQVNAVAPDPGRAGIVYVGTEGGGIFKSIDGGANWVSANTGLTHAYVRALVIDPVNTNVLYAGTWEGGVFRSTDGGASWISINTGLTNTYIRSLAVDPVNTPVVYAGIEGGGIFKLSLKDPPPPEDHVLVVDEEGVAVAGADVYQNGVRVGTTDYRGVYVPSSLTVGDTLVSIRRLAEQATVRGAHATPDSRGANWAYRIGLTSMDVTASGSTHPYIVTQTGRQQLVVKKTNPLVLYNLLVSIQWDATLTYTQQVSEALRLASDYLYDVTNGQFAFGNVTIYDHARYWSDADIQITARNSFRPYAFVGGITSADKAWSIRVGRGWDRRADSRKPWNEPDGFRTLIHEFGHYGLYLYDEYFEYIYDDQGNLLGERPSACTGPENRAGQTTATNASIMDWQYTSSELAMRGVNGQWSDDWCRHTAQWQLNQESDWETIIRCYADPTDLARWTFVTPADRGRAIPGPDTFPRQALPFPAVAISNTGTDAPPRLFSVLGPDGAPYPGAIVALDPARGHAIDQGVTGRAGEITILGAAEADKVRAMSIDGALSGAVVVTQTMNYTLRLGEALGANSTAHSVNPYVSLVPDSDGRTLYLSVQGVEPGGAFSALVVQSESVPAQTTPLSYSPSEGAYTGAVSFSEVNLGTGGMYVRGLGPQGQPVAVDGHFNLLAVAVDQTSDLYSSDGSLQLHLDAGSFSDEKVYVVLMSTGAVPQSLPPGRQTVGNAYAIRFSGALTETAKSAVLKFSYHPALLALGTDPHTLGIYRWNPGRSAWEWLGGELDEEQHSVTVAVDRIGIYALMAAEGTVRRVYLPVVMR